MPRITFLVVWGVADTMETLCPHILFTRVDFPDEGLPIRVIKDDFNKNILSYQTDYISRNVLHSRDFSPLTTKGIKIEANGSNAKYY